MRKAGFFFPFFQVISFSFNHIIILNPRHVNKIQSFSHPAVSEEKLKKSQNIFQISEFFMLSLKCLLNEGAPVAPLGEQVGQ